MKNLSVARSCSLVRLTDIQQSGAPLKEQVQACVNASPCLILDTDGLQFTSMMLGDLVNVYSALKERWPQGNVAMGMIGASDLTRQVMRISRLDQTISVFDTLENAWRALAK